MYGCTVGRAFLIVSSSSVIALMVSARKGVTMFSSFRGKSELIYLLDLKVQLSGGKTNHLILFLASRPTTSFLFTRLIPYAITITFEGRDTTIGIP